MTESPTTSSFTKVKLPYGWLGNMSPYPTLFERATSMATVVFKSSRSIPS